MCKKYINHENYEITAIPEFSGEDVVEEVTMVSIKDLALVEVGPCCSLVKRREGQILSRVRPLMNPNKPRKNWKKEAKIF